MIEVKCVNQIRTENNDKKHNVSYSKVKQRSIQLRMLITSGCVFIMQISLIAFIVQLRNSQTIETSSAFTVTVTAFTVLL